MNKEEKCKELLEKIKQTPDNIIEEAIDSLSEKMNKEEIEDIKDNLRTLHKVLWNEHKEGTYTIERILEYINCLEQKESILDKVTDKLKEDIKEFDKLRKSHEMYSPSEERLSSKYFYALKLLKFIEGEKK